MGDLPERGIGVTFAPGLEWLLEAGDGHIDVVEIEPQAFWFDGASNGDLDDPAARMIAGAGLDQRPALVHGVGAPIGGTIGPTEQDMGNLASISERLDAAWVSEHLSFNRFRTGERVTSTGLMLPPVQSLPSAELAAAAIVRYRDVVGRPFAFETGVNYLEVQPGELPEGAWWRAIAEMADCGIVLDLHNVWCNARNGRQPLEALLDELPLERVWEVHVAGGEQRNGLWLDAHSGLVDTELLGITAAVVPRLPGLRAITFEIVPEYLVDRGIGRPQICGLLDELRRIWDLRRPGPAGGVGSTPAAVPAPEPHDVAAIAAAEITLASAVVDRDGPPAPERGIAVMRELVEAIRRGLSVTVLPLTLRLLRLEEGRQAVDAAFEACWRSSTPELFADAEAANVAAVLRTHFSHVPHLVEVLDYELAVVELVRTGVAPPVRFTCEPIRLLEALGRGQRPLGLEPGTFELALT